MRNRHKKPIHVLMLCAAVLSIVLISACAAPQGTDKESARTDGSTAASAGEPASASAEVFAMDTYNSITCYGDQAQEAADASAAEIERIDSLFSTGSESSEISLINKNGTGELSEDAAAIVEAAMEIYEETDGAFDMTVYPLMELWGFTSSEFYVPSEEEIAKLLEKTGSDKLEYDAQSRILTLGKGQGIDFGGIAKGYASDRVTEIFKAYELESGVASLGGNVACYGRKPDGELWRVGIENPKSPDIDTMFAGTTAADESIAGIVRVEDKTVITSGGYQRYFTDEETGKTYYHILDPETGRPVETDILSATIVSGSGIYADALSTACFVMGKDAAIGFWREYRDSYDFEMVLICDDAKAYVTEGLEEFYTETVYESEIIRALE